MRAFFAVVGGLFIGSFINMALIQLNTSLNPPPPGFNPQDMSAFAKYIAGLPPSAFLLVMVAHLAQAFFGGLAAAWLNDDDGIALALIVGAITAVGGLINLLMLPAPWWMWLELPLYPVVALLAGFLDLARRGKALGA